MSQHLGRRLISGCDGWLPFIPQRLGICLFSIEYTVNLNNGRWVCFCTLLHFGAVVRATFSNSEV